MPDSTFVYCDPICAPNIGLNQEQVDILSKQGKERIAAENAAKEAAKNQKLEARLNGKGQGEGWILDRWVVLVLIEYIDEAKEKKGLFGFLKRVKKGREGKEGEGEVVR